MFEQFLQNQNTKDVKNLLSILLLIPLFVIGQTDTQTLVDKFKEGKYEDEDLTINYRLFLPEIINENRPIPLVITFHSAMTFGSDNESHIRRFRTAVAWSEQDFQKNNPCIVLAPQYPGGNEIANVNSRLRKLVNELIAKYPIDIKRIYVTGTSSGAFSALKFTVNNPELVAAGIYMSGGAYRAFDDEQAKKIVNVPAWFIHGNKDGNVPVSYTRQAVASIEKAGATFVRPKCEAEDCKEEETSEATMNARYIYSELPTSNHFYWNTYFDNEKVKNWLFGFTRK